MYVESMHCAFSNGRRASEKTYDQVVDIEEACKVLALRSEPARAAWMPTRRARRTAMTPSRTTSPTDADELMTAAASDPAQSPVT